MTSRNMRISLVTAAVIAALAATSCGTSSLNEGYNDDLDLISSTVDPEAEGSEAKSLMEMELDHDFELDDRLLEIYEGQRSYDADTFRVKENADIYEEEVGLGFDGENWGPIMKPFLLLTPGEDEISSAIWTFKGASKGLNIQAVRVQGKLELEEDNGYYIAVSNYATGRYELLGPFQDTDIWINIGEVAVHSPLGHLQIGVIMHDGIGFSLDEFEVSTEIYATEIS